MLLDVCRYFKSRGHELKFVFLKGGPFLEEFRTIGPVLTEKWFLPPKTVRQKINGFIEKQALLQRIGFWKPDLVYANTVVVSSALPFFEKLKIPILMHVHELEGTILKYVKGNSLKHLSSIPVHHIAVSESVKENLISKHGISERGISLIYSAIDTDRIGKLSAHSAQDLKKEADFLVGGAGMGYFRKGVDLWLAAASRIKKNMRPRTIKFVWIGDGESDFEKLGVNVVSEIKRLGLEGDVFFTGLQNNPYPLYKQFDLFLLSSREDPCPLVVLENMYLEKPVICFKGCGGAPEILEGGAGISVEDKNAEEMAGAAEILLQNPKKRTEMGQAGKKRAERLYGIKVMAEQIEETIKKMTENFK